MDMAVSKYTAKDGKVKWYFSVRYTDWTGERKRKKQEGFKTQKEAKEAEAMITSDFCQPIIQKLILNTSGFCPGFSKKKA